MEAYQCLPASLKKLRLACRREAREPFNHLGGPAMNENELQYQSDYELDNEYNCEQDDLYTSSAVSSVWYS